MQMNNICISVPSDEQNATEFEFNEEKLKI